MDRCLDEERIVAFVEHELAADEVVQVEHHIAICTACRRLISKLVRDSLVIHDIRPASPALDDTVKRPSCSELPIASGTELGRYQIERELGAGGMGRVYAAFDPVLERRVALKVLHVAGQGRLLHEARVMARLNHPNIVAVHEVGRAGDRDYVAMELVEGETLDEWLRRAPRSRREIVDAFVAAGRGLSAAHAAGIVHRDFKPHNVLRSHDGRVLVTDFGLAYTAETIATAASRHVHGTPAYMAPEQWRGEDVTPTADQFAFCVALWEALVGTRPYAGATRHEILDAIERGPEVLDAAKLSRQLSRVLRRGLRPDPARRWTDLAALLGELVSPRSSRIAFVAAATAAIAAVSLSAYVAGDARVDAAELCPDPIVTPAAMWTPTLARQLPAPVAAVFADALAKWSTHRAQTCRSSPAERSRRLACLDGVIVRIYALRRAAMTQTLDAEDVASQLVDPDVCGRTTPPRLTLELTPAAIAAFAVPHREGEIQRAPQAGDHDACGRALARTIVARSRIDADARDAGDQAVDAAEACGDDRILFDALIARARTDNNVLVMTPAMVQLERRMTDLLGRVGQPDVLANAKLLHGEIFALDLKWDEAISSTDAAIAAWGARFPRAHLHANAIKATLLWIHGRSREVRALAATALPAATALGAKRDHQILAFADAQAQWLLGDVAGAHARLDQLRVELMSDRPEVFSRFGTAPRASGVVVDAAGRPVAGARVAYDFPGLAGDAIGPGLVWWQARTPRIVTTDGRGRFAIDDAPPYATVVAAWGTMRSIATALQDHNRLVLEPTLTVRGRVDRRGEDAMTIVLATSNRPHASSGYGVIAPIAADGTFELRGVPSGPVQLGVIVNRMLGRSDVSLQPIVLERDVSGIELTVAPTRDVRVVVRATSEVTLMHASVMGLRGRVEAKQWRRAVRARELAVADATPLTDKASPELEAVVERGDLVTTLALPPIDATVCAFGARGGELAGFVARRQDEDTSVRCVPLPKDAGLVVIEVPPMRRRGAR